MRGGHGVGGWGLWHGLDSFTEKEAFELLSTECEEIGKLSEQGAQGTENSMWKGIYTTLWGNKKGPTARELRLEQEAS